MIKILGDINLSDWYFDRGFGVGTAIQKGEKPFKHLKRQSEDFWIGNLECVCSNNNTSPFVVSDELMDKINHLNLYCFANNHAMQIGQDGYQHTLSYFEEKNIPYCGSINRKSTTFTHSGKRIGILAFCMRPDNFSDNPLYWHLPEMSEINSELDVISNCDFKIAYVHWGYEFINYPNLEQRQMAHWMIDSGIDLVIGMHPHILQGSETYKNKKIFYSVGNAVFNMVWEPTKYGLIINVDLSSEKPIVSFDYIHIGTDYFPTLVNKVPYKYSMEYLDSLVKHTIENEKYFAEARSCTSQYTKANRTEILRRMIKMPVNTQISMIKDFIKRRIIKK